MRVPLAACSPSTELHTIPLGEGPLAEGPLAEGPGARVVCDLRRGHFGSFALTLHSGVEASLRGLASCAAR